LNGSYFNAPTVDHATCFNYAQGGARVTNPVGMGSKLLGGTNALLGQLTVPVVNQIKNHLSKVNGSFSGTELVTVMAGGNDVFIQLSAVGRGGSSTQAVTAMGAAGAELAGYVKNLIIANGAQNRFVKRAIQGVVVQGLKPRGIDKDQLSMTFVSDALNAMPGGLCFA
jgi:phospholipase/lecithinase/hemolysin